MPQAGRQSVFGELLHLGFSLISVRAISETATHSALGGVLGDLAKIL